MEVEVGVEVEVEDLNTGEYGSDRAFEGNQFEKQQELYDDVGGFGVLLAMGHEWEPKEHWINSMTLLADEVMPKLAHI